MTPSPEELAKHYAQLSEDGLMVLARSYDGLVESAQEALRAEFAKRGLEPPLVEEPEVAAYRPLVTIRRFRDFSEAVACRSLLESAEIQAWIADEHLVQMNWLYSSLIGGMRLQVDACNEAAALEVLAAAVPQTIDYGSEEVYEQPTCPKCGSADISMGIGPESAPAQMPQRNFWSLTHFRTAVWHCDKCDALWEDTEE